MRIAVLGGGVAGLACAHYLARNGHTPLVLEPSDALGQLGTPIVHEGLRLDRFSSPLRNSDTALCGLLADLGGLGRVAWRPTRSAIALGGAFYPVSSASDLLRTAGLAGLSGRDWVRAGLGLTYATQLKRYALHLHDVSAASWLPRVFGRRVYESWWRPFLEVRFGDYAEDVPAYWVWRQLNAYQTGRREIFGYLRGGIGWLGERLRRSIEARGGEVRLHAAITAVEARGASCSVEVDGKERRVEAVVSTLPPGEFAKLAGSRLAAELPNLDVPYQGRVTALVIMQRRVAEFYQTAFLDRDLPFQRVIEATHVVPSESLGSRHLVYVRNDCGPHTDAFKLSDDVVKKQALDGLRQWYPSFNARDVEAVHVSHNEAAEPITLFGKLRRTIPSRIADTRVFMCTSAQAYPRRDGWDTDVTLAREAAAAVSACDA
ncbi:MAG TPA: FAD-dependent oxidoreductase [Myxococcota bacterium]|nr:FAD-dependent oxidoreductase [Myxococcota bacterium]